MAKVHNLPPQAYTRDVLVKAIDWVATQSPSTRERASSADALVSLYLQSKRRQDWHPDASTTGENFRNDLKNLAEDLKQFDTPSVPPQGSHVSQHHAPAPFSQSEPRPYEHHQYQMAQAYAPAPQAPPPPPIDRRSAPQTSAQQSMALDPRSLSAAKEIQSRLNISSEADAIRFLITLGIERARQLFP